MRTSQKPAQLPHGPQFSPSPHSHPSLADRSISTLGAAGSDAPQPPRSGLLFPIPKVVFQNALVSADQTQNVAESKAQARTKPVSATSSDAAQMLSVGHPAEDRPAPSSVYQS